MTTLPFRRSAGPSARAHPALARFARIGRGRVGNAADGAARIARGPSRGTVNLLLIVYALALAAILGLVTADYATRGTYPFGGTTVGAWTTWSRVGAGDADPYIRAINARRGEIPLAAGEGLRLVATRDADGRLLDPACTYRVGGRTPPARAWTMTVEPRPGGSDDRPGLRTAFTSTEVLRETDGRFVVTLSPGAASGNWLPTPRGARGISLVLRLYDTPAAANIGTLEPGLVPAVTRVGCPS